MGRDAGWIALTAGVAGNAHVVLVPEKPIDLDHVCALLKYNHDHGKKYGIVVVAEGAKLPDVGQAIKGEKVDSFGHARLSGIAELLANKIEEKTGYETRSVNLGHTQRGGTPSAYDRMLATRYGLAALDLVHEGKFGRLVVLRGTEIQSITLAEAISKNADSGRSLPRHSDWIRTRGLGCLNIDWCEEARPMAPPLAILRLAKCDEMSCDMCRLPKRT